MSFYVLASYSGHDVNFDGRLSRIARKPVESSGFDLASGKRDIRFSFSKKDAAYNASKRLRAARRRGMTVRVYNSINSTVTQGA